MTCPVCGQTKPTSAGLVCSHCLADLAAGMARKGKRQVRPCSGLTPHDAHCWGTVSWCEGAARATLATTPPAAEAVVGAETSGGV